MPKAMKRAGFALIACVLVLATGAAQSQASSDYPNRPVKVIVPLAAGSSGDTFTRFFAERVAQRLGQPFVVENLPGANGSVGTAALLKAPADGYTVIQGTSAIISLNPILIKDLNYDPIKELKPVAGLIRTAQTIAVPAASPIRSLSDLVQAARTARQPLNSGTYGPLYLLAQEWFGSLAGIRFNTVSYKGANAAVTDLAGGQLDLAFVDLSGVLPLLQAGKVRLIAVTSAERLAQFPQVPTIQESGYPGFVSYAWASLFVRSDTPDDVVTRLADAVREAQASPQTEELLARHAGVQRMALGPAEMRRFQLDEIDRLRRIAQSAGITAQ